MANPQLNRHMPKPGNNDLHVIYKQFYDLLDAHTETVARLAQAQKDVEALKSRVPLNGPTNTALLGLPVQPIDTNTLADGATLKYNKKTGQFIFS